MAPPSVTSPVFACMQDIQDECFKLKIPLRTRHREVAPNQYEFAPQYGPVATQIDQNLMVMQILDEVAKKHKLTALLHEKPFQGINGSGKHNNWSLTTNDGVNLFNPQAIKNAGMPDDVFPIVMTAVIKAISENSELMRMSIATPGNDFRLGACEAPPAIITTYLGDSLTEYLSSYCTSDANIGAYQPAKKQLNIGGGAAPIMVPSEDRNRTSPFAFGGHRFEFRAVGSTQNVSMINTVLASAVAGAFKSFSDAIESEMQSNGNTFNTEHARRIAHGVAAQAWRDHSKVVFNGDGYDVANQKMLVEERGLLQLDSGIDAIAMMTDEKNLQMFESVGTFRNPAEVIARQTVQLTQYIEVVKVEAKCFLDMCWKYYNGRGRVEIQPIIDELKAEIEALDQVNPHHGHVGTSSSNTAATDTTHPYNDALLNVARKARVLRLEKMITWREEIEKIDAMDSLDESPITPYTDLLFIDQFHEHSSTNRVDYY